MSCFYFSLMALIDISRLNFSHVMSLLTLF